MKKFCLWLLVMALLAAPAAAETFVIDANAEDAAVQEAETGFTVKRMGIAMGEAYVYYPQLEGMADPEIQARANAEMSTRLGADVLLGQMIATSGSAVPLQADFRYEVAGDVLSVVMQVTGPVNGSRPTQTWRTANIDLTCGESVQWKDLFQGDAIDGPDADLFEDRNTGWLALADYLDYEVGPTLSAHLRNSEIASVPDTFALSRTGMTLYYDVEKLSTLSDRAGTVNIQWTEIMEHLNLEEGSVLDRLGAKDMLTLDAAQRDRIVEATDSGMLPGIPAQLGQSIPEMIEEHKLLIDPDLYEGGRLIQLEDGAFRSVYLLTDSMTNSWDHSVVQGIRTDRINLYGLCTGRTTMDAWREVLGQPSATVQVDADKADANRIVPGTSDYYDLAGVQLRLHADERGVLQSLFLMTHIK